MVSQPAVDPDGSYVGPSFHESTFNTHAVAMEEAGHKTAGAELATKIDAESRRTPAANQQDRDLLRARLMSARSQDAAAEAIYRKWTGYWKTINAQDLAAFNAVATKNNVKAIVEAFASGQAPPRASCSSPWKTRPISPT